ncbi:MAG: hypothetical protein IK065_01140, partial [Neisseriaceae bacterium]|nr:hypothetical protein [Neisseriaceae bacterium]
YLCRVGLLTHRKTAGFVIGWACQPTDKPPPVIASRQTAVIDLSLTAVSLRDCVSNRGNPI